MFRPFIVLLFLIVLTGCSAVDSTESKAAVNDCPVTEPAWIKPPDDTAVDGSPTYGHYFVNEDQSIMASAWWVFDQEYLLAERGNGIKTGWFRPAGAVLDITGQRLDGDAPPLEAHVPCCYPTRFQAAGVSFPTEGCWEITAKAAGRKLSFVVSVMPD